MTYAELNNRMDAHPLLNYLNGSLIGLNILLAIVVADWLNVVAALTGVVVTISANLGRIAHSIVYVRELYLNGWRLPKQELPTQPQNQEKKDEVG